MNFHPDIFGLAFSDYLSGNTSGKILVGLNISETEELPVSYFFRTFDQMPEWEQEVLKVCNGRVLDAGAGAGSHALYLQEKGLDITAIDISQGAVDCMRQRGIKKAVSADFFQWEEGGFDTILLLMNGTGMAQKIENLPELLKKAASLLAPGGNIYLESTDLLYMYQDDDGSAMIDLSGNYYGEVEYHLGYKNHKGEPFPWLFVDFENLSEAAAEAGLQCDLFYSGDTGNYIARLIIS